MVRIAWNQLEGQFIDQELDVVVLKYGVGVQIEIQDAMVGFHPWTSVVNTNKDLKSWYQRILPLD